MKTKLGPKLEKLFELIPNGYEVIWDTCCDHGKLGLACLEKEKAKKVIFVDQVPGIMKALEAKLTKIGELSPNRHELQTIPAQKIQLEKKKNLICICGVGGEETIDIIKNLRGEFDLLLSPQYHLFEVRRFLNDLGFKLIKEELCFEGKFGRELLFVSKSAVENIDPIGRELFDLTNEKHLSYVNGIIEHLKKIKSDEALSFYQKIIP